MRFVIFVAIWVAGGPAFAQTKPVAVVNGEAIPRGEMDAVLKLRPESVMPLTAIQQRQIYEQVVAMLVDEALLRQFLGKNTPAPDQKEIDKQFVGLVDALKAQGKTLAEFCKESQQTEKQIRTGIATVLRWNTYITNRVTDAELQKYYAENRDFFDKVKVRCSHIVLRVPAEAPPGERAEATKKLRQIRDRITSGKISFPEAAKNYSHCPSAAKGGDLGYVDRRFSVEEPIAKAAFSMKVNEVSDVLVTDFGVHIVTVTDRKPGLNQPFERVKEDVRDCYTEELRMQLLADLHKSAKIEINLP